MEKRESKEEAKGAEPMDNQLSSIKKRLVRVSEQKRSVEDALQKRIEKYKLFYQRIDDFIQDRISLDDVMGEMDILFKGHEELLVQFKRIISLYYERKTGAKQNRAINIDDAMNYVMKVKDSKKCLSRLEHYGDESTKYKKFIDILSSYRHNNTSVLEVYYKLARLFEDQQDLLEDFTIFV